MDKQLIERCAIAAMRATAEGVEAGEVMDREIELAAIDHMDEESKALTVKLFSAFLARIDAERGKEPVAQNYWRDVSDELPKEAQEVLFVRDGKTKFGAWIGGIFWHSNEKMVAAKWMPLPSPDSAPQPPAPCPKCAQHEIDFALEHDDKVALQAKVDQMTTYNETRTDELSASVRQCSDLQAKVADLDKENAALNRVIDKLGAKIITYGAKIAGQSARIEQLKSIMLADSTDAEKALMQQVAEQSERIAELEQQCRTNFDLELDGLSRKCAEQFAYITELESREKILVRSNSLLTIEGNQQSAEIERLTKLVSSYRTAWSCGDLEQKLAAENKRLKSIMLVDSTDAEKELMQQVAQQAERIAALEADNKAAWATADRHMTERSEARERIAELERALAYQGCRS